MSKFLALLALPIGLAAGAAGGKYFAPVDEACAAPPCEEVEAPKGEPEYLKLNNQFIVPVVKQERVTSLVVLSLSIEASSTARESVLAREPKLRDAFLRVMFDHAYSGAFDGRFTDTIRLNMLRDALTREARDIIGSGVQGVLITEIVRQEVG